MSTARKTSAKSNLDIARAIAALQEQVNENARAIKQALPKNKAILSDRWSITLMFSLLTFAVIFSLTFSVFYFNKLDDKIGKVSGRLDRLSDRLDKIYTLLLKNK